MLRIHQLKLPLDAQPDEETLRRFCARQLRISEKQLCTVRLQKRSVDARKRNDVCFVVSLDVALRSAQDERRIAARLAPAVGALVERIVAEAKALITERLGALVRG